MAQNEEENAKKDAAWKELGDAGCVKVEHDHGAAGIGDYMLTMALYCPACLRKDVDLGHLKAGGWLCETCLKQRLAATDPQKRPPH